MSHYSDILDNIHAHKTTRQYAGFNPMSQKKIPPQGVPYFYLMMLVACIACLSLIYFTFNNDSSNVHESSITNASNSSVVTSAVNDALNQNESLPNIEASVEPSVSVASTNDPVVQIQPLSNPPTVAQNAHLSNASDEHKTASTLVSTLGATTLADTLNANEAEPSNDSLSMQSTEHVFEGQTNRSNNNQLIDIHKVEKVSTNSISKNSAVFNVKQVLMMVADQQYDQALEQATYLPKTQSMMVQAKVYEKTDPLRAIELYQQLILNENSPIEYILKLAILNEKVERFNQSYYFYELYQKHNAGSNQSISKFVNNKLIKLRSIK